MPLSLAVVSAVLLATAVGCGGSPCGDTEGKVTRVIDGDTIELESGVKIRYLLVDTPEVSGGVECFGDNAKQYNSDLVLNKTVQISYDEQFFPARPKPRC